MKSTQNEKISQIKIDTLVVGIDIGKETHYARAFDYRGIELAKLLKFSNSAEGFNRLEQWMHDICKQQDKDQVIVGFEPTGHYWFSLGDHLKKKGHKLAIVNPFHVKRTKELDDNSPTKNDSKDPKTIAMLVKDGRYREVYIPDDIYQELREAVGERERLQDQIISIRNRVIRWLDIRFPEFQKVFKKWTGKAALMVLKNYPTPEKVMEAGTSKIVEMWKKAKMRGVGYKRAESLVKAAYTSIGRTTGAVASEASLRNLLAEYDLYLKQLEELEQLILELLLQVPNAEKLLVIDGVGLITVATFVGEVGDILRFQDPRQIQKLAGLNLVENSSGKHKGKTTISHRGRKRLRHSLFMAIIAILANNEEFQSLHQKNLTKEKPLTKMQSIIALCGKLIRVFYAVLKKGVDYSSEKMLGDIQNSMKAAA